MDFAYKATLTATVVAMVMLAARTFGPKAAGLLAGLPYTTFPALVWTGFELGPAVAAQVAAGSVAGCSVAAVFSLVYDKAARRFRPVIALTLGLAGLLAGTAVAHLVDVSLLVLSGAAIATCLTTLVAMGREPATLPTSPRRTGVAVALTALSAGAVSALVSAIALDLSPSLAGLLAALPVVGVAAVTAEHSARGAASVRPFLRGYVVSSLAKVAFGTVFALCVVPGGIVNALCVALLACAVIYLAGNHWLEGPRRTCTTDT